MIETSFHGVYLPGLMLLNGGALACSWALRRLLSLAGVYRWVWHPALFDLAVYRAAALRPGPFHRRLRHLISELRIAFLLHET